MNQLRNVVYKSLPSPTVTDPLAHDPKLHPLLADITSLSVALHTNASLFTLHTLTTTEAHVLAIVTGTRVMLLPGAILPL